jgi:hypothetical protein
MELWERLLAALSAGTTRADLLKDRLKFKDRLRLKKNKRSAAPISSCKAKSSPTTVPRSVGRRHFMLARPMMTVSSAKVSAPHHRLKKTQRRGLNDS